MKKRLYAALFLAGTWLACYAQPTVNSIITNTLVEPYGVAVDTNGVTYITDSAANVIYSYNEDNGVLTSIAGIAGQSGTNDGPGFVATFSAPTGIVYSPQRNGLVVADSGNHTLRFLTNAGNVWIVSTLAGVPGQAGYLPSGPALQTLLNNPVGLAVDQNNNILICDSKASVTNIPGLGAIRQLTPGGDLTERVFVGSGLFLPTGITVDANTGNIYIADTGNNAIRKLGSNGALTLLAGSGARGIIGTNDSIFAERSLFNGPRGVMWIGGTVGLLVSDSGNHTLRQVYPNSIVSQYFPTNNGYSVSTYAGLPGQPGLTDGLVGRSQFNSPIGLAADLDGGWLIADLGNHALRRIQLTPPLPQVTAPVIGYVTVVTDQTTGKSVMQINPVTDGVFNNDIVVAIKAETGATTLFTDGPTPGLSGTNTIPIPTSTSPSAPPYADGADPSQMPATLVAPQPDLTINAVGTASGRRPSAVVSARFQFQAAKPTIVGNNAASFAISTVTTNAMVWYTTDGSDPNPTNSASSEVLFPGSSETAQLSLGAITKKVTFTARAFKGGYQTSDPAAVTFDPASFSADQISFGFQSGEASSAFVASPGQTFIAPVTLTLLPDSSMYSLQFGLLVTNADASTPPVGGQLGFQSMLLRKGSLGAYTNIAPSFFYVFTGGTNLYLTNADLSFTNGVSQSGVTNDILGVGWLEASGQTNLYDATAQTLISYSQAHSSLYTSAGQKVVVGGFSFLVPATAQTTNSYTIKVFRPSATSDGLDTDLYIQAPTNGSLSSGAINAIKTVSISFKSYIVGDTEPFSWFNAGDFGDTNLLNNDVMDVFMAAAFRLNSPPDGTDFRDAMDSCCDVGALQSGGYWTNTGIPPASYNIYDGSDANINEIAFGDGTLDIADIYVTFRRSIDPTLTWFARYWTNSPSVSGRVATTVPNTFRGSYSPDTPAQEIVTRPRAPLVSSSEVPFVRFRADTFHAQPGQTIGAPIRAEVHGGYPVRALLLNLTVEPLDGAPPLTAPAVFIPAAGLGNPTLKASAGPANYAAAWLDTSPSTAGVSGTQAVVGTLRITLPAGAPPDSAYRIHFESVSGSPNGFGVLPQETEDGLVLFSDRSGSSWGDGIPDEWRLKYFGSASTAVTDAAPGADPDGDGLPNWAEYLAGSNPSDRDSSLRLETSGLRGVNVANPLTLSWRSAAGRKYRVEYSPAAAHPQWTTLADGVAGSGGILQLPAPELGSRAAFFRVILTSPSSP